jgi:hypothetical protein
MKFCGLRWCNVATLVSDRATKPSGILDQAWKTVFGPVLELVLGTGYAQWFLTTAILHPLAWLRLVLGGVPRLSPARI